MSPILPRLGLMLPLMAIGFAMPLAAQETRSFSAPAVKGVRLDWCKHWARDCGKPAADLFCREMGFQHAAQFEIDVGVGGRGIRTLVFGDGRICSHPTCSSFKAITCARAATPPIKALVPKQQDKPADVKPAEKEQPTLTVRPPVITPKPDADKKKPFLIPGIEIVPIGGELIQCWFGTECTGREVAIEPHFERQVVPFQANIKLDSANAILWQVADRPFPAFGASQPSTLEPAGLVASGRRDIGQVQGHAFKAGSFTVDIAEVAKKLKGSKSTFYVRALPVASQNSTTIVGGPTNVIKVLYGHGVPQAPPPPLVFHTDPGIEIPRRSDPLFRIRIQSFTAAVFDKPSKWGCVIVTGFKSQTPSILKSVYKPGREYCPESYKGAGKQIDSVGEFLEHMGDKVTGAWDWLGGKFDELKAAAVNIVMKHTGLTALCGEVGLKSECRDVASTALDAGLVALGVPPSIPNYNELIEQGVDHAVEVAASQVASATGVPCIGPCRDALRAGVNEFAENAKRHADKPGCVGTEEAHKRGREPFCLPDFIETKAAPSAVYAPPVLMVRITRRPEIPVPAKDHPACSVGADMVVKNFFPGGRVSVMICTGCAVRSKEVPAQKVQAVLFQAAFQPIPLQLAPGKSIDVPVVFNKLNRFVFSWTKELYSTSQIDVQPSDAWGDWRKVYGGGTAEIRALSGCAPEPSKQSFVLPTQ